MRHTLRLAERLEGEAITLPGHGWRIAEDVLGFAHKNNTTHIIVGKSSRPRWFEMLHGSVVHDLVRRAGNIGVHVIAGEEIAAEAVTIKAGDGCQCGILRSVALHRCFAGGCGGACRRQACAACLRARKRRPDVSNGHCRCCCALWTVAVTRRDRCSVAQL